MLYMIIEHFRDGDPVLVYRRLRDEGRLMPHDLRYVASWVTDDFRCCLRYCQKVWIGFPEGRARVTRQGPADAPCPHPSDSRPTCPDLLIRALAEGSLAVIHGNSLQANAAAGLERGECQTQLKSGW